MDGVGIGETRPLFAVVRALPTLPSGRGGETEDDPLSPPYSAPPWPSKPPPIGQRLLPNIFIESEIGQADKHVLKNVTRVEKFIQDVIRKTVEEELVFPNFHTLVLPDQSQSQSQTPTSGQ